MFRLKFVTALSISRGVFEGTNTDMRCMAIQMHGHFQGSEKHPIARSADRDRTGSRDRADRDRGAIARSGQLSIYI